MRGSAFSSITVVDVSWVGPKAANNPIDTTLRTRVYCIPAAVSDDYRSSQLQGLTFYDIFQVCLRCKFLLILIQIFYSGSSVRAVQHVAHTGDQLYAVPGSDRVSTKRMLLVLRHRWSVDPVVFSSESAARMSDIPRTVSLALI